MANELDLSGFDEEVESELDLSGFEEESQDESMGQAQAALQGVSQGATFGFGDEIAGGFEAAGQALGLSGLGGPVTDIGLTEEGPTLSQEKLLQAYREGREAERGRNIEAQQEHPGTYMAADVAAGFAIPIPGAGLLKTGKAAKGVSGGLVGAEKGLAKVADVGSDIAKAETGLDVATGATKVAGSRCYDNWC
jgi:hypothetical protein